jgi:CDP-diacylglycerol--serine O-phosphatidyltransferase
MKKQIPNIITLFNILSGTIGIVQVLIGHWQAGFILMIAAALFDFFDGMVARLLKVSSPVGKELDSLADVVSFGVLPGMMMYMIMLRDHSLDFLSLEHLRFAPFFAFLIPMMSAMRLAKFNLDNRQTSSFIGLPTPANALFIGALYLASYDLCTCSQIHQIIISPYFLYPVTLLLSWLLIAELPLFALKFRNLKWKGNEIRFIFILGSVILLGIFYQWIYMAILIIIPSYILLSVIQQIFFKNEK